MPNEIHWLKRKGETNWAQGAGNGSDWILQGIKYLNEIHELKKIWDYNCPVWMPQGPKYLIEIYKLIEKVKKNKTWI